MTNEGRADAVMLGAMAGTAALAAPAGAVLLQWAVGWANGWFALDPAIPPPGFWSALYLSIGCGFCIWLVNGVVTGVSEGLATDSRGEYLGYAISAPLCFVLLTLLYMRFLPTTLAGAAAVSGIMHVLGLACGVAMVLAFYVVFRSLSR